MSLILDALKKAKELTGRKAAAPAAPPTALASFRFGRPTRSQKLRRIALMYVLPGILLVTVAGYTANFWINRLRKPSAAIVVQPPPSDETAPAAGADAGAAPTENPADAAAAQPRPEQPKVEPPKPEASQPAAAAAGPKPSAPKPPPPKPAEGAHTASVTDAAPPPKPKPRPTVNPPGPPPSPDPVTETPVVKDETPKVTEVPAPSTKAPQPPAPSTPAIAVGAATRDPFEQAVLYQKLGEYPKALEQYKKVLEKDEFDLAAHNNMGLIYLAMGKTTDAITSFRTTTIVNPKYDKGHNNLGLALRQAGRDAEARRAFEQAVQLNPKNAEAISNLAGLIRKSGNIESAKTQYLKALQVSQNTSAEAHYGLALIYEEEGEVGRALEHYRNFIKFGADSHPNTVLQVEKKIEELSRK